MKPGKTYSLVILLLLQLAPLSSCFGQAHEVIDIFSRILSSTDSGNSHHRQREQEAQRRFEQNERMLEEMRRERAILEAELRRDEQRKKEQERRALTSERQRLEQERRSLEEKRRELKKEEKTAKVTKETSKNSELSDTSLTQTTAAPKKVEAEPTAKEQIARLRLDERLASLFLGGNRDDLFLVRPTTTTEDQIEQKSFCLILANNQELSLSYIKHATEQAERIVSTLVQLERCSSDSTKTHGAFSAAVLQHEPTLEAVRVLSEVTESDSIQIIHVSSEEFKEQQAILRRNEYNRCLNSAVAETYFQLACQNYFITQSPFPERSPELSKKLEEKQKELACDVQLHRELDNKSRKAAIMALNRSDVSPLMDLQDLARIQCEQVEFLKEEEPPAEVRTSLKLQQNQEAKGRDESLESLNKRLEHQMKRYQAASTEAVMASLETEAERPPEFFAYYRIIEDRVKDAWRWHDKSINLKADVDFEIYTNGAIGKISLHESSGNNRFDQSVLRSIRKVSPLPPPPENIYKYFRLVRMTFDSRD